MTAIHEDNAPAGTSRFTSVFGPHDDGTRPDGGSDWDPPYLNSGSPSSGPGVPTGAENITWWKDIEIQDWTGAVRAAAWTSDSLHNASPALQKGEVPRRAHRGLQHS